MPSLDVLTAIMCEIDRYDAEHGTQYRWFLRDISDPTARQTLPLHLTASLFPMSQDGTQVALVRHRMAGRWLQPGGHLEANELPFDAAARECFEETGRRICSGPRPAMPAAIDIHRIGRRPEKAEPEHYHMDLRYCAKVSGDIVALLDEVDEARWFPVAMAADLERFAVLRPLDRR